RRTQFRLPPSEAASLLKAVLRSGFGSLPDTIGGGPKEKTRQKGRITVSVGDVSKTVVQLEDGDQSSTLQALAERFLRASVGPASRGVRVSTFADGFEKLSAGTLAPQALQVVVQRVGSPGPGQATDTWSLRLDGRLVSVRRVSGSGPGTARTMVLS